MRRYSYIYWICLMIAALASCSSDDAAILPDREPGYGWFTLSLHMSASDSRAEIHPDEAAVNHEAEVEDLTVFIYSANLNGNASTRFNDRRFVTSAEFLSDVTVGNNRVITARFKFDNYQPAVGDRIAVVANMGDITSLSTLGQLQNYIPTRTWTSAHAIPNYRRFTMASAYDTDGIVTLTDAATQSFSASVTIERTAARIDLASAGGTWLEDQGERFLQYTATNTEGKREGTVFISHVLPFNVMGLPSYALKRVSATATDNMDCFNSWTYAADVPVANGKPTAYIIEPRTTLKSSAAQNAADWFGTTRAQLISSQGKGYFTDKPRLVVNPAEPYTILGYANENTAHVNHTTADNLTGIVIRAQYVPAELHTNVALENPVTDAPRGTDLWRYVPLNGTTAEDDVLYFQTEEVALAYQSLHPEDMASVIKFDHGECYYHLWLKHVVLPKDDPDMPRPTFPMEYGIVRNHIYRVSLSFRGIGRQGTEIDNPFNVEMSIFVRPWRFFTHETIIM